MTRFICSVLCVLACSLALSCRKPPSPQSTATTHTGTPAQPPANTPPAPPKPMPAPLPDVLARVNGEAVQKRDFDRLVRNLELGNGPIPVERRHEVLRSMLDQLITYTVMRQEARTQNVTVSDADVDQRIKQMRGPTDDAAFKKALEARNTSLEQLRTDARIQLTIEKLMESQVAGLPSATEAEARGFYEKNPEKFKHEVVRASHILLKVDPKASDATRKQTRVRIDGLLKRSRSGEDFATLAREHSQDGSAQMGGDLGYFARDRMVPPFAEAAFALKPGQISNVVTTDFGYHIIKMADRQAVVPYDQVNRQILEFLTTQKKQERAGRFINDAKKRAHIEVLV